MASETQSGGTFANSGTGNTWVNPGNAASSDDSRAIATLPDINEVSKNLDATNFGFGIPAGATIDGIEVKIERSLDGTAPNIVHDNLFRLLKGGSPVGDDKQTVITWQSFTDEIVTYGGSSDLWGTTWSVAEINASGFGVSVAVINTEFGDTVDARIDHIPITVYYTAAAGEQIIKQIISVT